MCDTVIIEQDIIETLEHDWNKGEITTSPSCTEDGVRMYTCSRCTETKTDYIPAKGHSEVIYSAAAPTCTETGLTEGEHCSACGTIIKAQEESPALGHSWDEGVVTAALGKDTAGIKTYTYTVCGKNKTETIPATGGSTTHANPDDPNNPNHPDNPNNPSDSNDPNRPNKPDDKPSDNDD